MPDSTNTGGRKPRVTDDDLLDVFRGTADPVLSTAEVADAVPIKRRGTLNRLRDLEDAGTLDSKQIGGRNTVWWLAEDAGWIRPTPDQSPTNSDAVDTEVRGSVDTSLSDPPAGESDDESTEDPLADALDGWEPDTEANPRTARTQTRRAAEWLRDVGEYRRAGELKDALAEDSTLSRRVWWERHARPGLNHLADADLVEYIKNRGYRWVGDTEDADAGGVYDPTEEF